VLYRGFSRREKVGMDCPRARCGTGTTRNCFDIRSFGDKASAALEMALRDSSHAGPCSPDRPVVSRGLIRINGSPCASSSATPMLPRSKSAERARYNARAVARIPTSPVSGPLTVFA